MVRELTEAEKKAGYSSIIHVRPAPPTIRGKEVVDTKTGETIGHIPQPEYERRQPGQRKFRGELFVEAPPRPEVEATIRKREGIKESKELAEKRGEAPPKSPSETWEAYIAKHGTKAQIPSTHIIRKYRPQLEEAARREAKEQAKFPTKEKRIRETLARQTAYETREKVRVHLEEKIRPTPTTKIEFQKHLFTKMGYKYTKPRKSTFEIEKEGRKQVYVLGERKAEIPSTAKFQDVYGGLGTGKIRDTFGVPYQGLGEGRYKQYKAIGEKDIKYITPISKKAVEYGVKIKPQVIAGAKAGVKTVEYPFVETAKVITKRLPEWKYEYKPPKEVLPLPTPEGKGIATIARIGQKGIRYTTNSKSL